MNEKAGWEGRKGGGGQRSKQSQAKYGGRIMARENRRPSGSKAWVLLIHNRIVRPVPSVVNTLTSAVILVLFQCQTPSQFTV